MSILKNKRIPAVAGKFYPANRNELERDIKNHLISPLKKKQKAIGVVSPHAGFMYSGDVAGAVYSQVEIPDTVIIMGQSYWARRKYLNYDGRKLGHAHGRCLLR